MNPRLSPQNHEPTHDAGFTLIELIITFAAGILILGGMLSVFFLARQTLVRGANRAELVQNGRIALERLSRDIRQAETLVTSLPPSGNDPANPPQSQIEFQDGHDLSTIRYIRYHIADGGLYQEHSFYTLPSDPSVQVHFDEQDSDGSSAQKTVTDDQEIAEYVRSLSLYGSNPITVTIRLSNSTATILMTTTLYGQNLH